MKRKKKFVGAASTKKYITWADYPMPDLIRALRLNYDVSKQIEAEIRHRTVHAEEYISHARNKVNGIRTNE